jgi:hypothetical protein
MNDFEVVDGGIVACLESVPTREQIETLERNLAALPQTECGLRHIFAPGLYAREMTIPAEVMLTGKIHKTTHLNIVSAGEITVWTEQGMKRVKAPHSFVSYPGTKRVGFTHSETVWTTLHVTTETDLARLEELLTEPSDILIERAALAALSASGAP